MNRLWTIMRKEVFHIWRDPRTLAMIVVLPALLLVLLGFGISFEQQSVGMAVADFRNRFQPQFHRTIHRQQGFCVCLRCFE